MDIYRNAVAADPKQPAARMKLGLLLPGPWYLGRGAGAVHRCDRSFAEYGEAWREKGIVENKLAQIASNRWTPTRRQAKPRCAGPLKSTAGTSMPIPPSAAFSSAQNAFRGARCL